LKAFKVKILHR